MNHYYLIMLVFFGCTARTPGVSGGQYVKPAFQHAQFIGANSCGSCHEVQRPAPLEGAVHGGGADCLKCHTPKDDNSGWLPVLAFNHQPTPTECLSCHAADRPAAPHPQVTDCVACHVVGAAFVAPSSGSNNGSTTSGSASGSNAGTP